MSNKQNDTFEEQAFEQNECSDCGTNISWGIARTSINRFRRMLCIDCQIKEIDNTYPAKLAEFAKKELLKYKHQRFS